MNKLFNQLGYAEYWIYSPYLLSGYISVGLYKPMPRDLIPGDIIWWYYNG